MKVLILSDFSEVAINATHFCMDLLHEEEVDFTLFNVAVPKPGVPETERDQQVIDIKKRLEERVRALQQRSVGTRHHFQGCFSEENLVNGTRAFLSKKPVDLIVMGAVGADQKMTSILGEHTFEIMRKVKCSILAVPENAVFNHHHQKIIMPLLKDTKVSAKHLALFKEINSLSNSLIEIREIVTDTSMKTPYYNALKEVFSELALAGVEKLELNHSVLYEVEYWKAVQKKYDLICLFAKNINVLDRLLNVDRGALRIIENRLPMLVLHE